MDYEFTIDKQNKPVAKFSTGHEAIGRWISEELGSDQSLTAELLDYIRKIERREIQEHQILGNAFKLVLSKDNAEVFAFSLNYDVDEPLPENTNLYDLESFAECGILDFKQAILDWQQFVY